MPHNKLAVLLCLKKNNHALYEHVLTMIISYSYPEWKKCSKYVIIQAADEMYKKKKDSDCHHKDGESVPFTVA